jgi:hypothetical protein
MLRSKTKLSDQSRTFPSRVQQLRAEASAIIDAKADEMKKETPGLPLVSLRNLLTAPYAQDVIDSALAILANEERN